MQLTPSTYRCLTHGHDLTDAVKEALEEQVPVAFRPRPERFEVIVHCPGGDGHGLVCSGTVQY